MVFSKIAGFFSARSRTTTQSSSLPYMWSGLRPPQPNSAAANGLGYAYSGHKNNLRLSSSLQDFTTYQRLDQEEGIDGSVPRARLPHPLQRENIGSSFSKEKVIQGKVPFLQRKWVKAMLLLLCILLFAFLVYMAVGYVYSTWYNKGSRYYVVLDCGSTGTRVYVYQATINYKKDGSLPIVVTSLAEGIQRKPKSQSGRAYDRMETEPGFHKLVHNLSGLKSAINPLLRWAEKQIPKHAQKSTRLFLYATAGVRRLPSSESKWLLDHAWSVLKKSPFMCQRDWVKIISGVEEAYFGWAALNYQTKMLGAKQKHTTFGALDLGGSSLQVTFESEKPVLNEASIKLKIGDVNHHLYAYSLAGYGLNDAFDKSVVQLFKRLPRIKEADLVRGNIEVKHPCLHNGYKEKYTCSLCASAYQDGGSPLSGGKNIGKRVKSGIGLQLVGAPNWEACSSLAKNAVNLSQWSNLSPGFDCDLQPCALSDGLPRPYGQFYAISGFFVVYRFFNLSSEATLDDVLEKGREFCEKKWEVAKSSVAPQPFIEQYCFRAPYISSLLRDGLHITDKQITIGSGSITWTLGVALLEVGKTFPSRMTLPNYRIFQVKINPIILLVILCTSLFFLVCALSCVSNWMPRILRRPYLPLFRHNSASSAAVLKLASPFRFSAGDVRVKAPLSPTVAGSQERLSGGSVQLVDTSLYPVSSGVSHSYSSNSLGQMPFDNNGIGSIWPPHRSQMRLQSRRSQSREDLNSSLSDVAKV